ASVTVALLVEIATMRSSTGGEVLDGGADRVGERVGARSVELPRRHRRVQPDPPERLVDQQVSEPGDAGLVEQTGLQGGVRSRERPLKLLTGDGERIGTERPRVRIQLDPAQATGIREAQAGPVLGDERETVPTREIASRAVLEP